MSDYIFGQFSDEHLKAISKGIILFNDGLYWECHEELEDLWLDHTGDNARYVYWAILQVAAAIYHYNDSNLLGAWGMISKAQNKIKEVESRKVETGLLYKYLKWKEFKELVFALKKGSIDSDYNKISSFKFSNPKKWGLE